MWRGRRLASWWSEQWGRRLLWSHSALHSAPGIFIPALSGSARSGPRQPLKSLSWRAFRISFLQDWSEKKMILHFNLVSGFLSCDIWRNGEFIETVICTDCIALHSDIVFYSSWNFILEKLFSQHLLPTNSFIILKTMHCNALMLQCFDLLIDDNFLYCIAL